MNGFDRLAIVAIASALNDSIAKHKTVSMIEFVVALCLFVAGQLRAALLYRESREGD